MNKINRIYKWIFENNFANNSVMIKNVIKANIFPYLLKPSSAGLIITNNCNLRCKSCNYPIQKYDLLDTSEWFNVLDDLKNNNFKNLMFSGGEIFLRKDWLEILNYAKFKKFRIAITTNGTLIDRFFDKLHIIDHFTVSLDSLLIHDDLRGISGTQTKVINNLELLKTLNKPIAINFVVQRDNYLEIPDMVKFCKKNNFEVSFIMILNDFFDNTLNIDDEKKIDDKQKFFNSIHSALNYNLNNYSEDYYKLSIRTLDEDVRRSCLAPMKNLIIQPDGNVFCCCGNLPSIGNVKKMRVSEMLQSKMYKSISKKAYQGQLKKCLRCNSTQNYNNFNYKPIRFLK